VTICESRILDWLLCDDEAELGALWAEADRVRREHAGDAVHLRGLVEIASHCDRACLYCGMRQPNRALTRYRLTPLEILDCAREAVRRGYGTLVLQAGEDRSLAAGWVADVVGRIKDETPLAVTLSLGERPVADYALWREAGADRYLLRFETGDPELFRRLHPPRPGEDTGMHGRLALVKELQRLGYETGSGIMVGLPGQTYAGVARDIARFADLDLDMVGIGCYVPHPGTPLGREHAELVAGGAYAAAPAPDAQIPNSARATLQAVALTRLVLPRAHLPASTALATVSEDGYAAGLRRGCNVIMPNLTPDRARRLYDIYPTPLRSDAPDDGDAVLACLAACGRPAGRGPGGRIDPPVPSPSR